MAEVSFEQELDALKAEQHVRTGGLSALSDLSREQQARFRTTWVTLPLEQRQRVVRELVDLAELSVELDFRRAFMVALDDPDGAVVAAAIDGLWEDESTTLLRQLIAKAEHSESEKGRAAALRSLGRFALLVVTGKLDAAWAPRLHDLLLPVASDPKAPLDSRRGAVESVAVFANDEVVHLAIAAAYADRRLLMRASALYAMGRNLDLRWLEPVLEELESPEPSLRYEAARASGELGSQRAVQGLLGLLDDHDREAQLAAVAALGKLGGRAAATALRKLLQSGDETLRDAAEEALDELNFSANPLGGVG